jgi:hypothetical protein
MDACRRSSFTWVADCLLKSEGKMKTHQLLLLHNIMGGGGVGSGLKAYD